MNSKSEQISIKKIFDGYRKDFSSGNILKIINKNRLKFLVAFVVIILLVLYEGVNYAFDFTGRQAKRISDKILESLSNFAKEDLIKIYDKLSTHDNKGLKEFATGISNAIKNGESITANFRAMKELEPKDNRTPEEKEKARIDLLNQVVTAGKTFIENSTVQNFASALNGKYGKPLNLEELIQKLDMYVIEYVNDLKNFKDKDKEPGTNNLITESIMKVINLVLKCNRILVNHVYSSKFNITGYTFSGLNKEEALKNFEMSKHALVIILENNGLSCGVSKTEKDIIIKIMKDNTNIGQFADSTGLNFGKMRKKRTSKKRTSKKRTSKKIKKL